MAFGASMGMKAGAAFIKLGVQTGQSGRRVDQLGRKVMTLRARFGLLKRGFGDVRMGLSSMVQGMRPAVFAGVAASAMGLRETLKFDQEIANLTSVTGNLGDQAPAIKRGIKALALDRKNNATAIEAAQAYTMMARSGVDASKRLEAASVALRLASLDIKLSTDDAAIFATKTARQFGLGYEEIGNKLARAADAIPGNVSDITTAMQYAGPAALQMGLKMDEALSMVMAATTRMRASRAGTAIGQFLTAFAKPTKLEALDKILKGAGMQSIFNPKTGKIRKMGDIIRDVNAVFRSMNDQLRGEKMYEVFGIRATRALTMFMEAASQAGQGYDDMLKKVQNGITLEEKAANRSKGLMASLKHIRSALGVIAIDFFGALFGAGGAGGAGKIADTIADVARAFGALVDGSQEAQQGASGLSEGVWAAARGIKDAVEGVRSAFAWLGGAVTWVAGLFGLEGTQQVTKFLVTFAAVSPIVLVVGMGIMMLTSILRGVFLAFSGVVRIAWHGVAIFAKMVAWTYRMISVDTAALATKLRHGRVLTWWHGVMTRANFALATHRSKMQYAFAANFWDRTRMRIQFAGGALKGLGKGLLSVIGPMGLVAGAMMGLEALFSAFTSEVEETKEELGRPTKINIAPEREGTLEALWGKFASPVALRQMGLGGLETPGSTAEFAWGKGEETKALMMRLKQLGEASGQLTQDKLKNLGLSADQVTQLYQIHGSEAGKVMQDVGLGLTGVIKTYEELQKAEEAYTNYKKYDTQLADKTANHIIKIQSLQAQYILAFQQMVGVTEGGADVLSDLFAAMDEAAKNAAVGGAALVGAGAEANAAAADKNMKKCLENNIKLNVGGRELASVVSRAQLDINERGGASVHPWQRHIVTQDGAEPVSGMA